MCHRRRGFNGASPGDRSRLRSIGPGRTSPAAPHQPRGVCGRALDGVSAEVDEWAPKREASTIIAVHNHSTMRQDQAEEGDLLAPAPDLDHRLAEVDLGVARRMMQWNEGLARRLPTGPDIVLHDRIPAHEPVLVPLPLEDPMRRVALARVRRADQRRDRGLRQRRAERDRDGHPGRQPVPRRQRPGRGYECSEQGEKLRG